VSGRRQSASGIREEGAVHSALRLPKVKTMRREKEQTLKAKRKEGHPPDPRLVAFARLLARDLARRHFREALDRDSSRDYAADPDKTSADLP
jgi:hypothetical protein